MFTFFAVFNIILAVILGTIVNKLGLNNNIYVMLGIIIFFAFLASMEAD